MVKVLRVLGSVAPSLAIVKAYTTRFNVLMGMGRPNKTTRTDLLWNSGFPTQSLPICIRPSKLVVLLGIKNLRVKVIQTPRIGYKRLLRSP